MLTSEKQTKQTGCLHLHLCRYFYAMKMPNLDDSSLMKVDDCEYCWEDQGDDSH